MQAKFCPAARRVFALASILIGAAAAVCSAQPAAELADDQAALARKFERLQTLAKRIAEMTEADDPARAEQLRGAIRKSQRLSLPERFGAIVELLEQERLAAAARDQNTLADQLQVLLGMLLADPNEARIEAERKRLKEALKRLDRQIRQQDELRSAAEGEDAKQLAERQASLADDVERLEGDLRGEEPSPEGGDGKGEPGEAQPPQPGAQQPGQPQPGSGQPGEASPPGEPQDPSGPSPAEQSPTERAGQRLAEAQKRMQQAVEKLEESKRDGARSDQIAAQRALEDAREEIEQALRQLREEEQLRMLTKLATRLRRILAEQSDILELTRQTEQDRPNRGRRATTIAATGLANREAELVLVADGALRLLREDGMSVAFPEVISLVREDLQGITKRLRQTKLGEITQRLQQEVIDSLAEAIDSLDKTLEELEERRQNGQQGAPSGEPGEPPVVDKLAELRMIRAIQARILRRTKMWEDRRAAESNSAAEEEEAEAVEALRELGRRERKLMDALRNLDRQGAG